MIRSNKLSIAMYRQTNLARNLERWQMLFTKYSSSSLINIYTDKININNHILHLNDCFNNSHIHDSFIKEKRSLLQIHTHPKYGIKSCVKNQCIPEAISKNIPIVVNHGHFALGDLPHNNNKYIPLIYWYGIDIHSTIISEYLKTKLLNKITVSFTPYRNRLKNNYHNKGTTAVIDVLEKLKKNYPKSFDYFLIEGQSYENCLKIKSQSHIVIDDINSGNYNQGGFEGLALGRVVIGNVSEANQKLFEAFYGTTVPYVNITNKQELLEYLENNITQNNLNQIIHQGKQNRAWMEKFWNPELLIKERCLLYERVLNNELHKYTDIAENANFNSYRGGRL
jgi:hypothetical protein